VAVPIKRNI